MYRPKRPKIEMPGFGREEYLRWRSPRFGDRNPTAMDNPVWEWGVRMGYGAYVATELFGRPAEAGPGWCFDRMGQTETPLPDGRRVFIAGEHEDFYDPDFCIYNDVVVRGPGEAVSIYGYPENCFPPTDFHTATLVGEEILIVGCLGYPRHWQPRLSQVFLLDTRSFDMRAVATAGEPPGWIHSHTAALSEDGGTLLLTGGLIHPGKGPLLENLDDWALDFKTWHWTCVQRRNWPRWSISRADEGRNHLWEIRQALWSRGVGWEEDLKKDMAALAEALGKAPDLTAVEALYRPDLPHQPLPEKEKEHRTHRIEVEGVIVRYVEDMDDVSLTVEGSLPVAVMAQLVEDVCRKMSALENAECRAERLLGSPGGEGG